jgi:hypothetical protein
LTSPIAWLASPPGFADITGYGLIFLLTDEHLVSAEQVAILAACVNCAGINSLAPEIRRDEFTEASKKGSPPGDPGSNIPLQESFKGETHA